MSIMGWEYLHAPDLTGRTIVMTGASDGLGREAALQLATWGADLVLAVRNLEKGQRAADRIVRETGRESAVRLVRMDLADLASVREGADAIERETRGTGIDLLIHVAGIFTRRREETADGFETMVGVNALAPFLLTERLLPSVRERIVLVTSQAHAFGRLDLADPHFRRGGWSMMAGYGRSKLLAMLWGMDLAERLRTGAARGAGDTVDLQLVHPGWVLTNLGHDAADTRLQAVVDAASRTVAMPATRGAESVLFAATQPLPPGSYIGPDGRGALRGRPTILRRSEAALDRTAAADVTAWARAEVGLG